MNILVTGSAGFIGSHLTEKLLSLGHTVTGIDNFDPFYARSIKQANLEASLHTPGFTFLACDLSELSERLNNQQTKFDLVVHLAAKAGVRPSIEDPNAYIQANVLGTFHVLEWMKKTGCTKMVFASSSSVYGKNKKIPFAECDPVDQPISPYAFTKKSCELLNHNYSHLYGMSIINLRFFTVYGPRQRPDLAIHKFFELIYSGKPIQIYGDGSTGRDYTYVGDTINGIIAAINRISKKQLLFETYNLGNSKPVMLKDLIREIETVIGKEAKRQYLPMQEGDVDLTYADITQAQDVLGFLPSTELSDGLQKFKEWFERKLVF